MYNKFIGRVLSKLEASLIPNAARLACRRSCESRLRYRRAFLKRLTANLVNKARTQLGECVDETRVSISMARAMSGRSSNAGQIPDLDELWHALVASTAPPLAVEQAAMEAFGHRHSLHEVFSDFVEMSALAISNAVDRHQFEAREKRYLKIAKRYEGDDRERFAKMFGALTLTFEDRVQQLVPMATVLPMFSGRPT